MTSFVGSPRGMTRVISWEDALNNFLTKESPCTKKRLKIRILDTVFLQRQHDLLQSHNTHGSPPSKIEIASWTYTSKTGGKIVKRKNIETLQLNHVGETFCRFALANPANAWGPRIAAVAYFDGTEGVGTLRSKGFTAEAFKLAIRGNPYGGGSDDRSLLWRKAKYLQCYLRPYQGVDVVFRVRVEEHFDSDTLAGDVQEKKSLDTDDVDSSYFCTSYFDQKITYKVRLFVYENEGADHRDSIRLTALSEYLKRSPEGDATRDALRPTLRILFSTFHLCRSIPH